MKRTKTSLMFEIRFEMAILEKYRAEMEEKYEFEAFKRNIVRNNYYFLMI